MTYFFFFTTDLRTAFLTFLLAGFLFVVFAFFAVFAFRAGDFFFAAARVLDSDAVALRVADTSRDSSGMVLNRDASAWLPFSLGNMML